VWKWLRYREQNPKLLAGLVAGGQVGFVKALARRVHYKPLSDAFFEALGWTQKMRHGHRTMAIGKVFEGTANFEGLTEAEICQRIVTEKIGAKLLYGLMPKGQEMTAAMWAAAIDAGSLSDKDLIILTPTLEIVTLSSVPEPATVLLIVIGSLALGCHWRHRRGTV